MALKTGSSKSGKIEIFAKGLTHGFGLNWPFFHFSFFKHYRRGKTIKTASSKSGKIEIFAKGLTHGFGPKLAIFPCFFFRHYRAVKCVLRYSRTKKRFSRL